MRDRFEVSAPMHSLDVIRDLIADLDLFLQLGGHVRQSPDAVLVRGHRRCTEFPQAELPRVSAAKAFSTTFFAWAFSRIPKTATAPEYTRKRRADLLAIMIFAWMKTY